jgi:hypothetical protein
MVILLVGPSARELDLLLFTPPLQMCERACSEAIPVKPFKHVTLGSTVETLEM